MCRLCAPIQLCALLAPDKPSAGAGHLGVSLKQESFGERAAGGRVFTRLYEWTQVREKPFHCSWQGPCQQWAFQPHSVSALAGVELPWRCRTDLSSCSADSSGWASLWKKYRHCLPSTDSGHYITSDGITAVLRRLGIQYRVHEFPSGWDITECFVEGDSAGGQMMDFLTGTKNFLGTAPPALRRRLQEALCQPECSSKKDGRVIFCNNLSMIVVES